MHTASRAPFSSGSLIPAPADLPAVFPTSEFAANGRPLGQLRSDLYRTHGIRNVFNIIGVWVQSVGVIVVALWLHHPLAWVVAFFLMGRAFSMFAILGHEAAHRLLLPNRKLNDFVGKWFVAYPAFVPLDAYRRGHMAHHKEEFGPNEPDLALYAGYPITKASWHRKLRRDAFGSSGWKNLKGLLLALKSPSSRGLALRILGCQAVIATGFAFAGYPLVWPLLWLAPWMTTWRVINRLRAIAEHGGATRSSDRRLTTHVIAQSPMARFWIVPYNTGWHLAHHVDIGVPFQNLPRLHEALRTAGWIPDAIEYPSYRSFWAAASARPAESQPTQAQP